MKSRNRPNRGRRRFLFGPGMIIALIVAAILIASGWLSERNKPDLNAGRIVYEADSQGRMRRVDAPSIPKTPPLRLWKPEVALLLQHAELRLDAKQRKRLEALDAAWLREKAELKQDMSRAVAGAAESLKTTQKGKGASTVQIRQGLQDYSALSRWYDTRRAGYWDQATSILTGEQRKELEKITATARRAR